MMSKQDFTLSTVSKLSNLLKGNFISKYPETRQQKFYGKITDMTKS